MATTKERNTVNTYSKSAIMKELRDSETAVMGAIKTYEEQVEHWKANIVKEFADFVEHWDKENGYYKGQLDHFAPPRLSPMCQDYRIQNLNRAIARIEAMAPDTNGNIKLYRQDPVFDFLAYAACL